MTRFLAAACMAGVSVWGGCMSMLPPSTSAPEPTPVPTVPVGTEKELVPATADTVGTKGKDYGGGVLTEPIRQRFRLEDRVLLLAVEHCLQLYNAEHGRFPKSHDEFMKDIVQANQIRLPALPPGQNYVYDPSTHTLMVERPKK